jgi:ferredoxin
MWVSSPPVTCSVTRHPLIFSVNEDQDQPKRFEITLLTPKGDHVVQVAENEHIWDAAFAQGVKLPALCHQGWCLTCAGRIEGPGETDQSDSLSFYPQDRAAGFALLCTGKPCSSLRIRTNQAIEMRKHRLRNGLPAPYSYGLKP